MAAKGSRKNPYTLSEYNSNGDWRGGWIIDSDEFLIYRTTVRVITYTGQCSKYNPVPGDIYEEMRQNRIWLGGWVKFGTTLKYVDSYENEYNSTLGNHSNPCSTAIYNEMMSNGIWESGWIIDSFGESRYIQSFDLIITSGSGCGCGSGSGSGSGSGCGCGSGSGSACGCGCGCGSGSGSGSGSGNGLGNSIAAAHPISAGTYNAGSVKVIFETGETEVIGDFYITWTAGSTNGQNEMSTASVSIRIYNSKYSIVQSHAYTSWESPYVLSISGAFTISYRNNIETFPIDTNFLIPEKYHVVGY